MADPLYALLMQPADVPDLSLDDFAHRPAWMAHGACRGEEMASFFPSKGGDLSVARAACARCEVRERCLAYAVADAEVMGFWGGTSERERQRMRVGRVA